MGTRIVIALACLAAVILFFKRNNPVDQAPPGDKAGNQAESSDPRASSRQLPGSATPPAQQTLPLARTITDDQGRSIEGTVMAKRADAIRFRRAADGSEFVIPIARLTPADRSFFEALPNQIAPEVAKTASTATTPATPALPPKPVGRVARWNSDFQAAKRESQKLKLPIYVAFIGPEWCHICQDMDEHIFHSPQFADFANRRFVLMKVLVPAGGKMNAADQKLVDEYSVPGYPTVVITSSNGKAIYQETDGFSDPDAYLSMLETKL